MRALIEDVLEYSQNSQPTTEDGKEIVSLETIIHDTTDSISEYIKDRNASIEVLSPLPNLVANSSKLFALSKNLIENGIKYNQSDVPIIKVYCKKTQGQYSIFFEDNGIGIPSKFHERVFQMFARLHTQKEYEGTGLGLAMCKKIVEEIGGSIHIESEPDIKSIFRIDLPAEIVVT